MVQLVKTDPQKNINTAPAQLHPRSSTIVAFYRLNLRFRIAEFEMKTTSSRLVRESEGETSKFIELIELAMAAFRHIINELVPARIIQFAPDVIAIPAAGIAIYLFNVSSFC